LYFIHLHGIVAEVNPAVSPKSDEKSDVPISSSKTVMLPFFNCQSGILVVFMGFTKLVLVVC